MSEAAKKTTEREELASRLVAIRRQLHEHPELSHEEHRTTDWIRGWLEEADIRIVDYSLRTGVIAEVGGALPGPIVALRADIDALPVQEETGLPFASRIPGKMHACGHDYHTASLIGAAYLLKQKESELKGTVRLIFQPAEEKAHGAIEVIESGALDGVSAIFGVHNKPDLPVGTIGIKEGPLMAAADGFVVKLEGVGSHAAVPEASVDPIVAAAHLVTALQSIVSRNVSPLKSAVISVTRIHSGTAWNVIPEHALLDGTLRTFDEEVRTLVRERFDQVTEGVAAAFGVKANVKWIQGPPAVNNDKQLAEAAVHSARSVGLQVVSPAPSPAGEDFAFYQQAVPGAFFFVGTSGPREWHHPSFDLDERALPLTASFFSRLAEDVLAKLSSEAKPQLPIPTTTPSKE